MEPNPIDLTGMDAKLRGIVEDLPRLLSRAKWWEAWDEGAWAKYDHRGTTKLAGQFVEPFQKRLEERTEEVIRTSNFSDASDSLVPDFPLPRRNHLLEPHRGVDLGSERVPILGQTRTLRVFGYDMHDGVRDLRAMVWIDPAGGPYAVVRHRIEFGPLDPTDSSSASETELVGIDVQMGGPAGTFKCEAWRVTEEEGDKRGSTHLWFSPQVPGGIVKAHVEEERLSSGARVTQELLAFGRSVDDEPKTETIQVISMPPQPQIPAEVGPYLRAMAEGVETARTGENLGFFYAEAMFALYVLEDEGRRILEGITRARERGLSLPQESTMEGKIKRWKAYQTMLAQALRQAANACPHA